MTNEKKKDTAATATPAPAPLLSAEEILASKDLDYVDVPVPEWTPGYAEAGGENQTEIEVRKIRIQVMSAAQAMSFAAAQEDEEQRRLMMIKLVADCAVDAEGEPLFSADNVEALTHKNFRVFQRLQAEALVLNGFATEDEGGTGEEEAKNG